MFLAPTAQQIRNGIAPTIEVFTTRSVRLDGKPEKDEREFEEAAKLALAEALDNGYQMVSFEEAKEFITVDTDVDRVTNHTGSTLREMKHTVLGYRYLWTFTAHDPIEEPA